MTCPLCQHRFEAGDVACAPACPLRGACRVICCPRCRYAFVEESSIVSLAQRLARWWSKERSPSR